MYKVARASEYLVITGWGISDVKLAKKSWVFPGQSCSVFDLSPVNYSFEVQAMSAEKLPFILPAVFTIGPRVDDEEALFKYAKLISSQGKNSNHTTELVQGIIEGETRVLAASMTMEEIFKGTKEFKQEVFGKVQLELNQFGLLIYNANVKQLVDVRGHENFSYLGQKTQMEAANQAKIDVAEARMKGEIGSKLRDGQTLQNAAKIDAETKIVATQRQGDGKKEDIRANAELAKKKAGWAKEAQVAEVESVKAVAPREAELQTEVERKNAFTRTEKLRAELSFLSKASVEYETKVQEANWDLYKKQKSAEAILYERSKEAQQGALPSNTVVNPKELLSSKRKLEEFETVALTEECSAILQNKLPPKLKDPGRFTIPCTIGHMKFGSALIDSGSSINLIPLMPYSVFKKLGIGEVKPTRMTFQLADGSDKCPHGVLEDVLMKVEKFYFPVDFVILEMEEDEEDEDDEDEEDEEDFEVSLILGRPFLKTSGALIDYKEDKLTLRVEDDKVVFNMFKAEEDFEEDEEDEEDFEVPLACG